MSHKVKTALAKHRAIWFWAGLFIIALAGVVLIWYSTPFGIALVNDSVNYIDGARNILSGFGYSRLLGDGGHEAVTNFPPLYPMFIAGMIMLGFDAIKATWWVGVIFYGINLLLVGWLARRISGKLVFGLLGGFLFILCEPFLNFHTFALTEPIFLFNYFLTLITLILYLEKRRWFWIVICGVFVSLTYLTRYIGASLFATVILAIIVFLKGWRIRVKGILFFLAGGLPGVIAWTLRNMLVSGNPTNRQIMFHPIPVEKITDGIRNFWNWLLPERFNLVDRFFPALRGFLLVFIVIFFVLVIIGAVRFMRQNRLTSTTSLAGWVLAAQAMIYVSLLIITLMFLDASINIEPRILMPVYNSLLLLLVGFTAYIWKQHSWILRSIVVLIMLFTAFSLAGDTRNTVIELRKQGRGFESTAWMESLTITKIRELPNITIFSNRPKAINLLAGRGSFILLSPINPSTGLPRSDYAQHVVGVRTLVLQGKAVIVFFDYSTIVQDPEGAAWFTDLTDGLPLIGEYPDGIIFGILQGGL